MKVDGNPSLTIQDILSQHETPNPQFHDKNISIPALILEYNIDEEVYFDLEDLKQFYNKFGEVLNIIINGKQHIVLFKLFLSAKICKIFLEDEENYKNNMKNNFEVRWFDINNDWHLIPDEVKVIFENIKNIYVSNNIGNVNTMNNNPMNNFNNMNRNFSQLNYINSMNFAQEQNIFNENMLIDSNNFNNSNNINLNLNGYNNNYINNCGIMNNQNNNFSNINSINIVNNMNHINNLNININDNYDYNYRLINKNNFHNHNNNINIRNINIPEDKSSQKFICKYEILIENDSEFQISRKLIGSKGANMKKIINECQIKGESETVKLRLRGKGSGFKEGPLNIESDEPLHLCISARNKEQLNLACFLVNKLFETIYEEYKFFCKKKGIKPKYDKIARKINENKNISSYFN